MVIIIIGLPGSGKSYFARRLSKLLDAVYINSDNQRKSIIPAPCYSDAEKEVVYNEMLNATMYALNNNKKVVLDATFYTKAIRDKFEKHIKNTSDICYIEIVADEEVIRKRLLNKREDSDADYFIYKLLRNDWEPVTEEHLVLQSTNDNINTMLLKAFHHIQSRNHGKVTNP